MLENVKTLWTNGILYTPQKVIHHGRMLVNSEGGIEAIGGSELEAPPNTTVRDLNGYKILPGFIDVHVHGGNGFYFMDGSYEHLDGMSSFHAMHGTTSFLATTTTSSEEKIDQALQCAVDGMKQGMSGAELIGVHLEGPFINHKRRGAQDPKYIRLPNLTELERYIRLSDNHIRLVTLAPEVEGGMQAVQYLVNRGITVSVGHSDATFQQVAEAVQYGANHTTHHFNGMSPFQHREPGVAGAGLILPQITTELIADGIHVHPAVVKLLFDTKTVMNVCMVTDAVFCASLPDGEYDKVNVTKGQVYLKDGSTLAGSSLTTIQALINVIRFTGYPLEKIIPSLTQVPARQIGMDHRKGTLEAGKDADFLIVDDELNIQSTVVKGREVYRK